MKQSVSTNDTYVKRINLSACNTRLGSVTQQRILLLKHANDEKIAGSFLRIFVSLLNSYVVDFYRALTGERFIFKVCRIDASTAPIKGKRNDSSHKNHGIWRYNELGVLKKVEDKR